MLVTLEGIVKLVSELHWPNAASPMLVTPSEIVRLVSAVQFQNA